MNKKAQASSDNIVIWALLLGCIFMLALYVYTETDNDDKGGIIETYIYGLNEGEERDLLGIDCGEYHDAVVESSKYYEKIEVVYIQDGVEIESKVMKGETKLGYKAVSVYGYYGDMESFLWFDWVREDKLEDNSWDKPDVLLNHNHSWDKIKVVYSDEKPSPYDVYTRTMKIPREGDEEQ